MNSLDLETELAAQAAYETPLAAEDGEKYISFELSGQLCCVAASGVAEVVQPMTIATLPNSPAWLMGLGPYRGEPVAVIDPKIFSGSDYKGGIKAKIIVFRARPLETQFALPIDSLHEMITLPFSDSANGTSLNGQIYNGRPVKIIEHERLFQSLDAAQP